MSKLAEEMVRRLWDEASPIVENYHSPDLWELQLFAYFPSLKVSSLFGFVFVKDNSPLNMVAYGPCALLLEDDLPEEKDFYVYVVGRQPAKDGIRLDYLLPYVEWTGDLRVEEFSVKVDSPEGRGEVVVVESKIPVFARNFLEES